MEKYRSIYLILALLKPCSASKMYQPTQCDTPKRQIFPFQTVFCHLLNVEHFELFRKPYILHDADGENMKCVFQSEIRFIYILKAIKYLYYLFVSYS